MENVGSTVENEEERKILKNIGIGTPATGAIIETLFDRGYIVREKKSIVPTDKGMLVYEIVGDKKIADAAMTAQWEIAFEKIENGEIDAEHFHAEVELAVHEITSELLNVRRASRIIRICAVLNVGSKVVLREKVVKCTDEGCDWVLFRNICGVQLSYRK
jgi:DNA topoisomerase-3